MRSTRCGRLWNASWVLRSLHTLLALEALHDGAGDFFAFGEGLLEDGLFFFVGVLLADAVVALYRRPHHVGAGVRQPGFGDKSATHGDVADQFAGDGAPAEGARDDAADLAALFAVADGGVVGRRDQEGEADLVHRNERRVRSGLTDAQRQR